MKTLLSPDEITGVTPAQRANLDAFKVWQAQFYATYADDVVPTETELLLAFLAGMEHALLLVKQAHS